MKTAANIFRRYCYEYREKRTAGIICAGWDEREGGQVSTCTSGSSVLILCKVLGQLLKNEVYGYFLTLYFLL